MGEDTWEEGWGNRRRIEVGLKRVLELEKGSLLFKKNQGRNVKKRE